MSGIAGFWTTQPHQVRELVAFTDMLEHRGANRRSLLTADMQRLCFGQRRLDPQDTDFCAERPVVSQDGRYAIVLDGEIYNSSDIRRDLEAMGRRFVSGSDAEVVLEAFTVWGPRCQDRFNGDWAVAIWDNADRSLFLSRDRFGNKPLIYTRTSAGFAFASESKAFFALPWVNLTASDTDPSDDGQLKRLDAGTSLTLNAPNGKVEIKRWWNPLNHISKETAPYEMQVAKFRDLLSDACRVRLRDDLPVAASVSGGLDSSAIVSLIGSLQAAPEREGAVDFNLWKGVFTATAKGTAHDELAYALSACRSAGIEPYVVDVLQECDPADIEEYLYLTEGLELNHLTGWYLYRAMREHGVRSSLDGHGADAMLAGEHLDVYGVAQLEGSWLRRPLRTLELSSVAYGISVGNPYSHKNSRSQVMLKLAYNSSVERPVP